MPVEVEISLVRQEDVVATLSMVPPVPISSWSIELNVSKRLGGETLFKKCYSSGYDTVSGIHILDSGVGPARPGYLVSWAGILSFRINSVDTSGWTFGNYAFQVVRLDSGSRTVATEGYLLVTP